MCWDSLVTFLKASGVVASISSTLSVHAFGSKGVDRVLAAHEVDIAAAQSITEFLILGLRVQADDRLARPL